MSSSHLPDLFAVIMGLCAIGLVAIPELVYVRDIYENGNARANTMFKLDISGVYHVWHDYDICDLPSAVRDPQRRSLKRVAVIGLAFFVWTCGYFGNSVDAWFGTGLGSVRSTKV